MTTDLVLLSRKDRKIRAHRKSRQGCGNCKLRRVKCDEGKPGCKRCAVYSILCNYYSKQSDLQISADGALNMGPLGGTHQFPKATISSVLAPSLRRQLMVTLDENPFFQLNRKELELLQRFRERTVVTITPAKAILRYRDEIAKLACIHPFLMHAAITVTMLHNRHLTGMADAKLSATEAFHYYQSIALFNDKLSRPLQGSERDALWVAAGILGTISFGHIEAKSPEEAWPLKPPSSLDFNWLSLSEGKVEVWRITNVLETQFRQLALEHMNFPTTIPAGPGLEALPSELSVLCRFNASSTAENNPYYTVALSVAQALNLTCNYNTNMLFFRFSMTMGSEYKRLLVRKDPGALLLLAYWYAKACQHGHWWIVGRAALECQAICIFLEKYHRHDSNVQRLLQFPKLVLACLNRRDTVGDLASFSTA